MKTYVVGRSPYADVVIADPSVAEFHAEIVTADDGRIFVGDCGSATGTWRMTERDGASVWLALRQDFVRSGDMLRFGDHECIVADLVAAASPEGEGVSRGAGKTALRPAGRLSRDPWTGEIVRRGR